MYGEDKAKTIFSNVLNVLHSMFDEYNGSSTCFGESGSSSVSHLSSSSVVEQRRGLSLSTMLFMEYLDKSSQQTQTELDEYMNEALVTVKKDLDILQWWKGSSVRFPVLSLMARDILAIPISTVASESAFSTGRRILDPFRSSLTPRVVEGLICAQDWMKGLDLSELSQEEADMIDNGKLLNHVFYFRFMYYSLLIGLLFFLYFRCAKC